MEERLGVIADDLTGAMDTAGAFASVGLRTAVALTPSSSVDGRDWRVLCVNTQSRNSGATDARTSVLKAVRVFVEYQPSLLYKKFDSTMRGHVAVELAAVIDASGAPYAFVCPAFPAMARTVERGVLRVRGVPLTDAPEGRDTLSPARSASVAEILQGEGLRPAHIDLDVLRSGGAGLTESIGRALAAGHNVVAFDAAADSDLASIAGVARRHFPDALLAGSAGLASAVARRMAPESGAREHRTGPRLESPFLVVSGSWNPVTLSQIDELSAVPSLEMVAVETAEVTASRAQLEAQAEAASTRVKYGLREGYDVALTLRPPSAHSALSRHDVPSTHAGLLGTFVSSVIRSVLPDSKVSGLVLTGGDTAYAVLSALGSEGVAVGGELEAGIPFGSILGGRLDRRLVVTKGGGFGDSRTLSSIVERLRRAGRDA